jgi:hypothetical protein
LDIKQEDLIKFWTWCGFTQVDKKKWATPEHLFGDIMIVDHLPELNLDSIYACAIPKLHKKYSIILTAFATSGFKVVICRASNGSIFADIDADTPTEALFNAIMKVIENEQSNK